MRLQILKTSLFIGAGIGVTPLVSMFNEVIVKDSNAQFIQVTGDVNDTPFTSYLENISQNQTKQNMNFMIAKKWLFN